MNRRSVFNPFTKWWGTLQGLTCSIDSTLTKRMPFTVVRFEAQKLQSPQCRHLPSHFWQQRAQHVALTPTLAAFCTRELQLFNRLSLTPSCTTGTSRIQTVCYNSRCRALSTGKRFPPPQSFNKIGRVGGENDFFYGWFIYSFILQYSLSCDVADYYLCLGSIAAVF